MGTADLGLGLRIGGGRSRGADLAAPAIQAPAARLRLKRETLRSLYALPDVIALAKTAECSAACSVSCQGGGCR